MHLPRLHESEDRRHTAGLDVTRYVENVPSAPPACGGAHELPVTELPVKLSVYVLLANSVGMLAA